MASNGGGQGPQSRKRRPRWVVPCLALTISWVILPVLLVAGLEVGLRAWGAGRPTQFLFSRETPRGTAHSVNMSFYKQFLYVEEDSLGYTPHDVPVPPRHEATYRVVVLGSSAALGWYFADFSFSRYLEANLRAAYPDRDIEVISLAWFGMNSHVMRVVAEHMPQLDPDVLVVYTGNNEMTGPFGLLSALGSQSLDEHQLDRAIRRHLWLSDVRLLQVMGKWAQNLSYQTAAGLRWGMDAPVTTIDDPRLARVYRHYERNLHHICDAAAAHGVPVLLGTVLRNERDWIPRNSFRPDEWTDEDEAARAALIAQGEALAASGEWGSARERLEAALAMDSNHARTLYRYARLLSAMGETEAARDAYRQAYHRDATLDYATPEINEAVRRVAADRHEDGVYLVDAVERLASLSPDGVLGRELLYDHIHPTREGNYELALAYADALAQLPMAQRPADRPARAWLPFDECGAWLGESREGLAQELRQAASSIDQFWPEQDTDWLTDAADRVEDDEESPTPGPRVAGWKRGVAHNPDDFIVRYRFIHAGLRSPEYRQEAVANAETIAERHPDYWHAGFARIEALQYSGQSQAAVDAARELVDSFPYFDESQLHLGRALEQAGEVDAAVHTFRRLARRHPNDDLPLRMLADALRRAGRYAEAIRPAERSLAMHPDRVGYYSSLDSLLVRLEDPRRRIRTWERLARRFPESGHAHHFLARALADEGRDEEASQARGVAAEVNPSDYGTDNGP